MKKIIISGFAFAVLLGSCGGTENKIEAEKAKEVKQEEKKETTVNYNNIKEGSVVNWLGSHVGGIDPHNGTLNISKGELTVTDGKIANGKFTIDMSSMKVLDIEEGTEKYGKLVGHLSNEDFFNVAKFPEVTFELTEVLATEGEHNTKVTGNLNLLGVEKSISFESTININEDEVDIKSETFTIDRTQWGNEYNKEGSLGVPADYIISNNITISIEAKVSK